MMGSDIERMVSGIDSLISALDSSITGLASAIAYAIETPNFVDEKNVDAGDFTSGPGSAFSAMSGDLGNMQSLGSGLYVGTSSFNNSIGSPWTELSNLSSAMSDVTGFSVPLLYIGPKAALLALLNKAMTRAVDAKWAIITYHDYIQRGYDNQYNGNNPSVSFENVDGTYTTGNLTQDYSENVKVPTPSKDPF
jgi:hypothetical protein